MSTTSLGDPAPAPAAPALLVTIGIPAYNRPVTLERAARSALAQDHAAVEILVSDDASPDPEVARVGYRLARDDGRVRYVRQDVNLGHAANYQWVLEQARGEYFMWLADDDWIDERYVSRCLQILTEDPSNRLVCGAGHYYRDGDLVAVERSIDLVSARSGARVVRYFSRVNVNGPLFGVARRTDLLDIGFPDVLGGDWLLVAGMAARGRVRTLADVRIHRSLTGLGSDAPTLARSFGLSGLRARTHHAFLAAALWRRIAAGTLLGSEPLVTRLSVATLSAALVVARFTLVDLFRRAVGSGLSSALEARLSAGLRSLDQRR